jgi:hypothetical protein
VIVIVYHVQCRNLMNIELSLVSPNYLIEDYREIPHPHLPPC